MKTFILGLIAGIVIGVLGYMLIKKDPIVRDAKVIEKITIDKHKTDSLLREISIRDALIAKAKAGALIAQVENAQTKKELVVIKDYADSLEIITHILHPECDSIVFAKNEVIVKQDSLINGLDNEIGYHKEQLKLISEQRTIDTTVIKQQMETINTLSCAYDWKIRHKFWAWLFRWKCKKD